MDWRRALNRWGRRVPVWAVYLICLLPMPWLFWLAASGQLSVEPIAALEHRYGLLALQFLMAGLCVTPLRRVAGINLLRFRRALGLIAFWYLCAHLLVWLVLDVQSPARIWADLVKRPYITVGMAGLLCLLPLALTSSDRAIRRLGVAWRRLHRLVYPAVILACLHFVMLRKGLQPEPLIYGAGAVGLLILRVPWNRLAKAFQNRGIHPDSGQSRG
ncbi:MAG: protein-methionine-sulfoxide reductase heme-binding subunit MsrQ [Qingshengfaniella sp.]